VRLMWVSFFTGFFKACWKYSAEMLACWSAGVSSP
jgi:hypothetical protein